MLGTGYALIRWRMKLGVMHIRVGLSIWAKARGVDASQTFLAHLQVGLAERGILNANFFDKSREFTGYPQTF